MPGAAAAAVAAAAAAATGGVILCCFICGCCALEHIFFNPTVWSQKKAGNFWTLLSDFVPICLDWVVQKNAKKVNRFAS